MRTNLIQNYISSGSQQQNSQATIKPLPGKGKLVSGSIFNAPAIMLKDTIYDVKAFKHAMKGDANDHELGKLNNVGLKLGGLTIAGYLFTKKSIPSTKGMEFIGLGSFLASMALWPKIAIQLPAYLIHGVNVQKQYEDSFGRRKPFYQDPQFIPWDLYSDEEIHKIGDRLGVARNIPNRRDFIQEKMKKIAVQNNTMWMLTAGFATPIMSALICNQAEPYVLKYVNNMRNKQADNILNNFEKYTDKNKDKSTQESLLKFFKQNKNKSVDAELKASLLEVMSQSLDPITAKRFELDFNYAFKADKFLIDDNSVKSIKENMFKIFEDQNFDKNLLDALFGDEKIYENVLNGKTQVEEAKDFASIKQSFIKEIKKNYDKFYKENPDAAKEDWKLIKSIILNRDEKSHPIKIGLKKNIALTLDDSAYESLKGIAEAIDKFKTKNLALDKYALLKVGAAPETVIANYWNNTTKDLLDILGFSAKEIEKAKVDEKVMGDLLRGKLEQITSDEASYKKVLKSIVDKISIMDKEIHAQDINSRILNKQDRLPYDDSKRVRSRYETITDQVFEDFASKMKSIGFEKTAKAIGEAGVADETGTAKNIQKAFVQNRLLGVKSAFYRLVNTLDFYRRVSDSPNTIKGIEGQYRGIKEELIELCKDITLGGHSSDHATKFYMHRNPNPNVEDTSDVVVKKGKIENKYLGTVEGVDISNDKFFYQRAMQAMFEDGMHQDTQAIIDNSSIKQEMKNYRELICERLGGEKYFAKPWHRIRSVDGTGSDIKFLLTGISPKEMLFKIGQQSYNSHKWLKTFATAGSVLLGISVVSQFFFGKVKNKND